MSSKFAENIVGYDAKVIRLPLRSRNPRALIRRLKPIYYVYRDRVYNMWIVCSDIKCIICIVKGIYRVEISRIKVSDRLSGLRHNVPLIRGISGGKMIWSTKWDGEALVVDNIECDAVFNRETVLTCNDASVKTNCSNIECIIRYLEETCGF